MCASVWIYWKGLSILPCQSICATGYEQNRPKIQTEALTRIEALRLQEASPIVQDLVDADIDPVVRGAAIRASCALADVGAVEATVPYLDSSQLDETPWSSRWSAASWQYPRRIGVVRAEQPAESHEVDDRCSRSRSGRGGPSAPPPASARLLLNPLPVYVEPRWPQPGRSDIRDRCRWP